MQAVHELNMAARPTYLHHLSVDARRFVCLPAIDDSVLYWWRHVAMVVDCREPNPNPKLNSRKALTSKPL